MTDRSSDGIANRGTEIRYFGGTGGGRDALRERTLRSLRRADGPLPLAAVACRVVAEELDCAPAAAPREDVQRVYLDLVRNHIPRLERRDVVAYSPDDGTVELVGPGTP